MGAFSEQLTEARKAAHLTQDQLAEKVHVTRAAVSHWENGRYIPDFDMIWELSKVLDYRFDVNDAEQTTAAESGGTVQEPETADKEAYDQTGIKGYPNKKWIPWAAVAAVLVIAAVLVFAVILPGQKNGKQTEVVSDTDSAVRYSVSDYQKVTPRETEKAYLVMNTESRVEHGEGRDYWMFTFRMNEDQGIAFHLDEVEMVYFFTDHAHPMRFPETDLAAAQIGPDIPGNHSVSFDGGCPLDQTNMTGVGLKSIGRDENGNAMSFTAYIPFPKQ